MTLNFFKYHGTGNDFILLDNRQGNITLHKEQVAALCHRRFGIGADGLMLLEHADGYDFRMVYYNSDGGESTMCGNGGRCIVAFAKQLGMITDSANFVAIDGPHLATLDAEGIVSLHMKEVHSMSIDNGNYTLDTGSPHFVQFVQDVAHTDVFNEGKRIRYLPAFAPGGTNVNFAQRDGQQLIVRTYERGVEDETYSCGTGVTAAAIASAGFEVGSYDIAIQTPGGMLSVSFKKKEAATAEDVVLKGPAIYVFEGTVEVM
ncbi:MAG: diaminopimelate epimerase [Sphingobacteriales bacterium]|nr:MAG: diaminopimelate epimerase [Sphingobacteriales bacterium]